MIRALAVLVPLLLAACDAPAPRGAVQRLSPRTSEAVANYAFAACTATIPAAERQRLLAFTKTYPVARDDTFIVSVPPGGSPAVDAQRLRAMRQLFAGAPAQVRYVAESGLAPSACRSAGIVRLVRVTGLEVDCRDGRDAAGCASALNLAAMMADPSDTFLPPKGTRSLPPTGRTLRYDEEPSYVVLPGQAAP